MCERETSTSARPAADVVLGWSASCGGSSARTLSSWQRSPLAVHAASQLLAGSDQNQSVPGGGEGEGELGGSAGGEGVMQKHRRWKAALEAPQPWP